MIGEDAAVGQEQVFRPVRFEGHRQKRHIRLFGTARALGVIAGLAGGHHVAPTVLAAFGKGADVIPGEHVFRQLLAAIETNLSVAYKQLTIRQRRHQVAGGPMSESALDRDDGADRDARALSADAVVAAAEGEGVIAGVPGDHGFEVEQHRFAPGNPAQWLTGHVES